LNASCFGMTFPKLPKEMNTTFSRFVYFPEYFGLVIIISAVLGVHIQFLCRFIATIRFMLHSTGSTFINPKLTFITSYLMGFSYFRSPAWFLFCIVSYDGISRKSVITVFNLSMSDTESMQLNWSRNDLATTSISSW
jgi:hypothetical protein